MLHSILRHTDIDNITTYRALAQRLGIRYAEADELFKALDKQFFQSFSRTFLDRHRLLPICKHDGQLMIATDDPDVSNDLLEQMMPCTGVDKVLVTSNDFRRLWSVLNISGKSNGYVQPPPQALAGEHEDFAAELDKRKKLPELSFVPSNENFFFCKVEELEEEFDLEEEEEAVKSIESCLTEC